MAVSSKTRTNLYVFFLLLIAFFLRINNLGKYALAGDEKYSLFVSNFTAYEGNNQKDSVRKPNAGVFTPEEFWSQKGIEGFNDAIARVDTGNGALYTYGLHWWIKLFGVSDFSLRFPSLIFNLLCLFFLFRFVKYHFKDEKLAFIVLGLAVISPFFIAFSQVARNYSLLYLLSLLSTDQFLEYLESKKLQNLILYGILALLSELCHISTFPLFLFHGIYVLIFYRHTKIIGNLFGTMMIPLIGMLLWLISDGGKYMFEYVSNSVKVYNYLAQNKPNEFLSTASPKNVLVQLQMVLSCVNISAENLYLNTIGKANYLITLGFSILIFTVFNIKKISFPIRIGVLTFIIFISHFIINNHIVSFVILGANFCLLFYSIKLLVTKKLRPIFYLLQIISIGSVLSLLVFSYFDGNTFRIMPRYIGYSYAFNVIWIAFLLKDLFENADFKYRIVFSLFVLIQSVFLVQTLLNVYKDNPPRYFMSFIEPRVSNPHKEIAVKILEYYKKGNLVIYPSEKNTIEDANAASTSVVDAQLVNFYLPKDSKIKQIIDFNEPNKMYILRNNGLKEEIFDFEDKRFRY